MNEADLFAAYGRRGSKPDPALVEEKLPNTPEAFVDVNAFWSCVHEVDGHWIWRRSRTRSGYGVMTVRGKRRFAHRIAWELMHGPVPDDRGVLHTCSEKACVRPAHLVAGKLEMSEVRQGIGPSVREREFRDRRRDAVARAREAGFG